MQMRKDLLASLSERFGADGAGAAARSAMGIMTFPGITVGTIFTLFVAPTMQALIFPGTCARRRKSRSYRRMVRQLRADGCLLQGACKTALQDRTCIAQHTMLNPAARRDGR